MTGASRTSSAAASAAHDQRQTLTVVTGYSVQMRTRIIDTWQAMEQERADARLWPSALRCQEVLRLAIDAGRGRLATEVRSARCSLWPRSR